MVTPKGDEGSGVWDLEWTLPWSLYICALGDFLHLFIYLVGMETCKGSEGTFQESVFFFSPFGYRN